MILRVLSDLTSKADLVDLGGQVGLCDPGGIALSDLCHLHYLCHLSCLRSPGEMVWLPGGFSSRLISL